MSKNILKEIIIILLLILAIILLLGVLLYDYVPMNKVVPEAVTYTASEDTQKALEEKSAEDDDTVVLSYEVTATDLKNYKRVNDYKAGRKNPFSAASSDTTGSTGTTSNNGQTSNNGSSQTGGSNNTNSGSNNSKNNGSGTSSTGSSTGKNSTNDYPDKGTK